MGLGDCDELATVFVGLGGGCVGLGGGMACGMGWYCTVRVVEGDEIGEG